MNEFRQNFLREFLDPLEKLQQSVSENYTPELRRDAMRLIHSIKGCSRTFGMKRAAEIAAGLESAIAECEANPDQQLQVVARLPLLIEALKRPRPGSISFDNIPPRDPSNRTSIHFVGIDGKVFDQLTDIERNEFFNKLEAGGRAYDLRVSVPIANFANDFKALRSELESFGAVIAVLPVEGSSWEMPAFDIILVCGDDRNALIGSARPMTIETPDENLARLMKETTKHLKRVSTESSKFVHFRALANDVRIGDLTKPIFEMILHLTANAVDHGISHSGKVELVLLQRDRHLTLSVADDGAGIDPARTDHLFNAGFTTSAVGLSNSGRGYGLFIVKTEVEKLNGKISVKSRKDIGTRFEITLPF